MFSSRFMRWNGLNSALANSNQFFTEDMLMIFLFHSNQLSISQNFMHILIHVIKICLFHLNKKRTGKLSFLNVEERSSKQGRFVTAVYRKPTFSGVYNHFDSFLSMAYKFGMIYTLAYWSFNICSNGTEFHEKPNFLKWVFLKNRYPFSFIDKCFKTVINKLIIKRPQTTAFEKKTLILSSPYLGDIPLQQELN